MNVKMNVNFGNKNMAKQVSKSGTDLASKIVQVQLADFNKRQIYTDMRPRLSFVQELRGMYDFAVKKLFSRSGVK